MTVLVTTAGRHGSTAEIAAEIADTLTSRGIKVVVADPQDVAEVTGYDAVILGSAIYAGHWLGPARELAGRMSAGLVDRPVWLFSSGPIGDEPVENPAEASELMSRAGAREHQIFGGKLDKKTLGFGERAILLAVHVPEGEHRDWAAIRRWAQQIADELTGHRSGHAAPTGPATRQTGLAAD